MVGRARSVAVLGLHAVPVTVEAHVGSGLPGVHIIGSSGPAAREAADRVRTALGPVGITLPQRKTLVSLAPADLPKTGARFDLAMAAALLLELNLLPSRALDGCALLGELALDGRLRPVTGVLPAAASLPRAGIDRLLVADGNAAEAALVDGLAVVPLADLGEAITVLRGGRAARPLPQPPPSAPPAAVAADLADVRGQAEARRALELAAAGGHHLLLIGPPGCGKSMLARRLPGILPPLSRTQALELAAVRSVAGLLASRDGALPADAPLLDTAPPWRAPHHSLSAAALLGGGSAVARPGEVSLAHRGVLFLDELFEWPRGLLEALRGPLEEGCVRVVARSRATVSYPARVQLVCAANPCPCGGGSGCSCADDLVWGYRARLSGPLADRLDLAPAVEPLTAAELLSPLGGEPSSAVAERVHAARRQAAERWGPSVACNAEAPAAWLRRGSRPAALRTLAAAVEAGELTGRSYDRALRVARTCADLDGSELVERAHVLEACALRLRLRTRPVMGRAAGWAVTARRV